MAPFLVVAVVLIVVVVVALVLVRHRGASRPTTRSTAPPAGAPTAGSAGGFGPAGLGARVRAAFGTGSNGDQWAALEEVLLKADVGPRATADLIARLRARDDGDPVESLRDEIVAVLGPQRPVDLDAPGLDVILVVGVNGSGKTTTIGKLASRLVGEGKRVSLAAADTFRAAAGEQLEVWGATIEFALGERDRRNAAPSRSVSCAAPCAVFEASSAWSNRSPETSMTIRPNIWMKRRYGVPPEPLVAGQGDQPVERLLVEPEVEDRVHHPGHAELGAGANADQERVGDVAEALAGARLDLLDGIDDVVPQSVRQPLPGREIVVARLGGDRETGGVGKPALVISARPAPLPPSRSRIPALPSAWPSPQA